MGSLLDNSNGRELSPHHICSQATTATFPSSTINMWLFDLFKLFYVFSVSLLPVVIDTGVQVWNGMEINATDFVRTEEWQCTHDCPGMNESESCDQESPE